MQLIKKEYACLILGFTLVVYVIYVIYGIKNLFVVSFQSLERVFKVAERAYCEREKKAP